MNYYQAHKNKRAKVIKRTGKFDPRIPLISVTAAIGAMQINILSSQIFPTREQKQLQAFNYAAQTSAAMINIERMYRLKNFKLTKSYGRGTIQRELIVPQITL